MTYLFGFVRSIDLQVDEDVLTEIEKQAAEEKCKIPNHSSANSSSQVNSKGTTNWPIIGGGAKKPLYSGQNDTWECPNCKWSNRVASLHCELCSFARPAIPTTATMTSPEKTARLPQPNRNYSTHLSSL